MVIAAHDLLEISSISGSTITTGWVKPVSGSLYTFTAMVDTPDTYVGQADKLVAVNAGESDLEFIIRTPSSTVVSETSYGQAANAGSVTSSFSRGDHTHGTPAAINPATAVVSEISNGQSPAVGASSLYARQDHTHGTPAAIITPSYQFFQRRGSDFYIGNARYTANCVKSPVSAGGIDLVTGALWATPFIVPSGGIIDEITVYVVGGNATCRLGVYKATSTTVLTPNNLISEVGTFLALNSSPGPVVFSGLSISISPSDLYWFALGSNNSWVSWYITLDCTSTMLGHPPPAYNTVAAHYVGAYAGWTWAGSLPATFPNPVAYFGNGYGSIYTSYHLA